VWQLHHRTGIYGILQRAQSSKAPTKACGVVRLSLHETVCLPQSAGLAAKRAELPLVSIPLCNGNDGHDNIRGNHRTQRPKDDVVHIIPPVGGYSVCQTAIGPLWFPGRARAGSAAAQTFKKTKKLGHGGEDRASSSRTIGWGF
jgi:hypothetical protein